MYVHFYIDPATDEPHIYGHGVSGDEVEEVLLEPGEDRLGRDGSRVAVGQTSSGAFFASSTSRTRSQIVITAYQLTGKPLAAYRRRRGRK